MNWWPFVLKSTYRAVKLENMALRDALREAHKELVKHRSTVGALAAGVGQAQEQFQRVLNRK